MRSPLVLVVLTQEVALRCTRRSGRKIMSLNRISSACDTTTETLQLVSQQNHQQEKMTSVALHWRTSDLRVRLTRAKFGKPDAA